MGQAISTTQFFLYGKRHFTAPGYVRHVKKYASPVQDSATIGIGQPGSDGIDLEGKVIAITGANNGLGKELATYAATKGATIYMICRSKDRAEQARKDILEKVAGTSTPEADNDADKKIKIILANVGELEQVRLAVKNLQAQENKLDCLVCNAGALLNQRTETSEGNEITFASHLLGGSYLLSQLLIPQLRVSSDPRVIFVTSGGMLTTKFPTWETATCTTTSGDADDKNYVGEMAYSYAKRGQVLLAERLTTEIPDIQWVTAHPGWTATPGVDSAFGDNKKYLEPMRNMWQGTEGIAWLMGAPKDQIQSGEFYLDRKPQAKHISGPFFSEGSFTKNTKEDVDEIMVKLRKASGL